DERGIVGATELAWDDRHPRAALAQDEADLARAEARSDRSDGRAAAPHGPAQHHCFPPIGELARDHGARPHIELPERGRDARRPLAQVVDGESLAAVDDRELRAVDAREPIEKRLIGPRALRA